MEQRTVKTPGYCETKELWEVNEKRMRRFIDRNIAPFLSIPLDAMCCDIGEKNPKMEYLKTLFWLKVRQIQLHDLNFSYFPLDKYEVIFALDVVEHLQNPLWFMRELRNILKKGGSIYVAMPVNPRWLWVEGHYFEIPRKHFEKWILHPLGMRIVRHKSFVFPMDWRGIFIGVRPLLRVLRGEKDWQSLVRAVWYRWNIYEIKL